MRSLCALLLALFLLLSLTGCVPSLPALPEPQIARNPEAAAWEQGKIRDWPEYDPDNTELWQLDLRSADVSGLDLTQRLDDLMHADFDTQTQWPKAAWMPPAFDRQKILEYGKNPGLGLRKLHRQGITGKGVGVAIIDQTLLVDHVEYADRLRVYEETEEITGPWLEAQMHGPAVASIAVGKTVGVAPEADLYYIANMCYDMETEKNDFTCWAKSVRRVVEINKGLPDGRKIRVLAMQIWWGPSSMGYEEMRQAVEEANAAGIMVVGSHYTDIYGYNFDLLGRDPLADPDKFESYTPCNYFTKDFYAGKWPEKDVLVPMDARTTAGPHGKEDYAYYRFGGESWSIPYMAGIYALVAQVKPDITPQEFWEQAIQTGRTVEIKQDGKTYSLGPILDPAALVAALQ